MERTRALDHLLDLFGELVLRPSRLPGDPAIWIADAENPALPHTRCVLTIGLSALGPITYVHSGELAPPFECAMIVRNGESALATQILADVAAAVLEGHEIADLYSAIELERLARVSSLSHGFLVDGSPLPRNLGVLEDDDFLVHWLVPLASSEVAFARARGPNRLMLLLRWSDVDLFDLTRNEVEVPAGISREEFDERHALGEDTSSNVLGLLEGERDRTKILTAVEALLASQSDAERELAVEVIETMALSEPDSFQTSSYIARVEAKLQVLLQSPITPFRTADALDALRHAAIHVEE